MKKLLGILLSFTLLLSACAHPSTDAPAGEQSQPPPRHTHHRTIAADTDGRAAANGS